MTAPDHVLLQLAPSGVIRAAMNVANADLARFDERTGAWGGPSVDLINALAVDAGVAVSILQYKSAAAILTAADRNEWDVALIAADPSRAERFAFSPPYAFVAATYLVPVGSDALRVADIDISGCRIVAAKSAAYTKQLERQLKSATIVYTDGPSAAVEMLRAGHSEAAAGLKASLELAARHDPRFRILDDAFSEIPQTIAVLKEKDAAACYLRDFIERTKI